ncbi:C2H2-type zinc finger protein [Candidatus Bathyarchaeota archaeon]|nr:C2H2-type zinc finger protein [Candidatus Bathyarchaeota archaeon]MBL7079142.1 C2H2-type zinc finger protein [Candidatus Bathyarchaeota archaeon]
MKADEKIKGIVGEVGLERNEDKFNSFSLTVGLTLKTGGLSYAQGERLVAEMRKALLGKEVEIAEIFHLCPVCEKGFSTMQGMKQHVRIVHEKSKKKETVKAEKPKAAPKKKRARKKSTRKKT